MTHTITINLYEGYPNPIVKVEGWKYLKQEIQDMVLQKLRGG